MEIYLIRHTTPKVSKGICYGRSDVDIDESHFEKEYQLIYKNLPDGIEKWYSSPLHRCRYLAQRLNADVQIDERLVEMDFGDWENCFWHDIDSSQLNAWMLDFVNVRTPNGENYGDLHKRTINFISDISKLSVQKIAIITHAGNIRSFISFVLSLPLENSFRIHLDYGAMASIKLSEDNRENKLLYIQNFKTI